MSREGLVRGEPCGGTLETIETDRFLLRTLADDYLPAICADVRRLRGCAACGTPVPRRRDESERELRELSSHWEAHGFARGPSPIGRPVTSSE